MCNPRFSKDFTCEEMMCSCGCGLAAMDKDFMYALQMLRDLASWPIMVNSGFRCRKYNEEVGGAANSYHIRGMAADIVIQGFTVPEMYELARQVWVFKHGGIGCYKNFIHIDSRVGKKRWQG